MSDSETDTETTYSNSIDSDNSDLYYEAEEISRTKYNIILCEIFNDKIHGTPINEKLNSHFLINSRFKILDISVTNNVCIHYNSFYSTLHLTNPNKLNHKYIRNYKNIITNESYIKPEIAECFYLETGECIAILKTFWIRLIQRKWKNILSERKKIIQKRCSIKSLLYREIYGKWPSECLYYPTLNGMMENNYTIKN